MVSDVDIVAVLLALCDPVTEVTSTDTIINATLTQDDPPLPCVPVIIITSVSSGTSFTTGYLTFSSSHKMNEEGWDSLSSRHGTDACNISSNLGSKFTAHHEELEMCCLP